jgi:alkylhydroperoxidase family enzyme
MSHALKRTRHLAWTVAWMLLAAVVCRAADGPAANPRFPLLSDEQAWKRLPSAEEGSGQPLPAWARALADALPRTTAAMLELDYLHRTHNPLEPALRGKMRWVAAHANRCAYTEALAAADLRRAGVREVDIEALAGDFGGLPEREQAALVFARKLTLTPDTVTDAEVAKLTREYGDRQVVAMVLLLAHANFQDRLVLALGLPLEEGERLKPLEVRFDKTNNPEVPPRQTPEGKLPHLTLKTDSDLQWSPQSLHQLQKHMDGQRDRPGRIAVPAWEDVRKQMPNPPEQPVRIRWSLVCIGYQPDLALGWSACTRSFGKEAKQDRVFEESLFWVVTRSLNCFY